MSTPEWLDAFRSALDAEFGPRPRIGTIATVDPSGRPRARSAVCRRVEADGTLAFAVDARSDKVAHARSAPFGEAVFWLPTLREQYRLAGGLEVVEAEGHPLREALWRELSDPARALFFGGTPGEEVTNPADPWPEVVPPSTPIPESFALMRLAADRVEHLDLKANPHRRTLWEATAGWSARAIHP